MIAVPEHIAQARTIEGLCPALPWSSFADFFTSRVFDRNLSHRPYLTYCDEDSAAHHTYSYSQFGSVVLETAAWLREEAGLRRGERLATVLFNHDFTVILYFAAWVSGVTVVPINVEESPEKKRFILEHSEAAAVCCWHSDLEELTDLQRELPSLRRVMAVGKEGFLNVRAQRTNGGTPSRLCTSNASAHGGSLDDEALIVYTSGTTGPPKGVVLTVANLLTDADAIADWHGFGMHDRLMCVLPIHHVNGTVVTLVTPFYFKGSVVLNRKFRSGAFWQKLEDEGITCVSVVPTLLEFLMDADENVAARRLPHFKGFICGAGPLLKDTAARFEDRFGFPIRHGYGLSETTCYSCFLPNDLGPQAHRHWIRDFEFPSIGVPLRHNQMAILDHNGQQLPETSRGEICIRGGTVCAGYYKRDDANDGAFQWGWFRSGDEGFYVRDGEGRPFFFISGRLKELIIRGGVNISPLEIDDALNSHPLVRFAMAVPFDHRYYGEEIAGYVVLRDGARVPTERDLLMHCRRLLPFSKCPKVILVGRDVPYTSTGKPKRLELRTLVASSLAGYRHHQFTEDDLM
ncbi:MAG TPA: class I adenylate-forming enzyme family protein [Nitrospira sp.]